MLDGAGSPRATLREYLVDGAFGPHFRNHFLLPVTGAIWSSAANRIGDFPVEYLLRFLDNHGLIGRGKALPWRTIQGGSMAYVDRLVGALPAGTVRSGDGVVNVIRDGQGVIVHTRSGFSERFDAVVMATHADDALGVLHDADARERAALEAFGVFVRTRWFSLLTPGFSPGSRRPGRPGTSTSWTVGGQARPSP